MTKEQIENIIQENMQKIYLYCVKKLENTAVAEANEVGAIVSMWSMMEGMMELALDNGFVTKGNGQNLTAFYFKTEKEQIRTLTVEIREFFDIMRNDEVGNI